jgi:putative endonuclease
VKDARRKLGQLGEDLAIAQLRKQSYVIHERNYRCPRGEIDIVARDGPCLVFVEVRTRRGREYGSPEESITPAKQAKLIERAQTYVQENNWEGGWRIDVVAVEMSRAGTLLRIEVIQNAVGG